MNRLPGLDLLRAIAILWVMYYHALIFHLLPKTDPVARFGWMGVDLFFVLSGFLIGTQLFRPLIRGDQFDIRRFYARRLFRTIPPYLLVVALYFAVPAIREVQQIAPLWRFLTFTQNLFDDSRHMMAFSHAWSLCVEEQFYLVVPIAVWLLARRPSPRKVVTVCVSILLGGMIVRAAIWCFALAPFSDAQHGLAELSARWMNLIYRPTWTRLDGLLAGVVLALIASFRPEAWRALMRRADSLLVGGLVVVALAIYLFNDRLEFLPTVFGFPLLAIGLGCLVAAAASPSSLIGRTPFPGAKFVAAMAYSLYLTHKAVYHLVALAAGDALTSNPVLAIAAYGGGALIVGALFYATVERPALILRDRALKPRQVMAAPALAEKRLA
jgi:peptidoglycan/LPS O-acetylase OafA/YrhL